MKNKKVIIINYGMGNLKSIWNALKFLDCEPIISNKQADLDLADAMILPGVGAFGEAMNNLRAENLDQLIERQVQEKGKPILGICLGMQLMAKTSEEGNGTPGLGWIPGKVKKMRPQNGIKIPHVGWNNVEIIAETQLFSKIGNNQNFYFLHSYTFQCPDEYVIARCNYGMDIPSVIQQHNIIGTQFHPERSSHNGLKMLKNFISMLG